jgi:hypothetical protein
MIMEVVFVNKPGLAERDTGRPACTVDAFPLCLFKDQLILENRLLAMNFS